MHESLMVSCTVWKEVWGSLVEFRKDTKLNGSYCCHHFWERLHGWTLGTSLSTGGHVLQPSSITCSELYGVLFLEKKRKKKLVVRQRPIWCMCGCASGNLLIYWMDYDCNGRDNVDMKLGSSNLTLEPIRRCWKSNLTLESIVIWIICDALLEIFRYWFYNFKVDQVL